MTHPYHRATFLLSAAKLSQLPPDSGVEVAFVGRSNAGKSSALNAITGIRGLAKTSNTPGRTQLINLFGLDNRRRLVDLPGYGYAKVAISIKERWQKTLGQYLEQRACLRGLILLMDIRHPLKEMDKHLLQWAIAAELPIHILLTKTDKLSQSAATKALHTVKQAVRDYPGTITVQLFSATHKLGIDEVRAQLNNWLFK